ncbi:8973_t:CDS:2, partial [Racocetra persica]
EQQQEIFSGAYQAEKRRINAVNAGCFMKVERVLNEVRGCLEQLDLTSIDSGDPIAFRIIDISEGVDSVADKLSVETKQVLEEIELNKPKFSEKMITMLDEFINIYELLGPNFDLALVNPITFSRDENNLGEHRVLLTTFDLLEGL